ncbi:hypothetical protein CEXT_60201 [Caerostris extrusa]|uniref:Uncharacterized protein n=1 Tax=Caerostris extrusa TaxID=172846 RepID=A0AAV4QCT0_CAEEX|nr:hypothetical protein CEXT_60201 [Caerostris extrusa]
MQKMVSVKNPAPPLGPGTGQMEANLACRGETNSRSQIAKEKPRTTTHIVTKHRRKVSSLYLQMKSR